MNGDSAIRYPKAAFTIVLFTTLVVLLGLNIAFNAVEIASHATLQFLTGLGDVKSEVLHLDERLTDRAIRFILTKEEHNYQKYREDAVRLEELLNNLRRHENKFIRDAATVLTNSNNKLVALEESGVLLAREGKRAQAYKLLDSEVYRDLKTEYSVGARGLANFIDKEIADRVDSSETKKSVRTAVVTIVMIALIGIWLWFLSVFADWKEKLETTNEELDKRVEARTKEFEEERKLRLMNAKLAAVGELAANLAHEVNNPLQIIALRSQQVVDIAEESDSRPLLELGDSLLKTTKRLTKIANGLRSLSRDGTTESLTRVDTERFLSDIVEVFEPRFASQNIKFEKVNRVDGLVATFRPTQISQVLMNLVNNAIDAVSKNHERRIILGAEATPTDIEFFVRDNGSGVSAENIKHIMEPFFTTKPFGEGTGLGLSISKQLVDNHRGKITYSRIDEMTEFRVHLPQDSYAQRTSPSQGKVVIS